MIAIIPTILALIAVGVFYIIIRTNQVNRCKMKLLYKDEGLTHLYSFTLWDECFPWNRMTFSFRPMSYYEDCFDKIHKMVVDEYGEISPNLYLEKMRGRFK